MKLRYLSGTGLLCQQRFWQCAPHGIVMSGEEVLTVPDMPAVGRVNLRPRSASSPSTLGGFRARMKTAPLTGEGSGGGEAAWRKHLTCPPVEM
jgi:hypothetical protein